VDRFEVRAGHGENVRRLADQIGSERLAAQIANVHVVRFANLHRVKARRLSAHRVDTGRSNFNVFTVSDQPAKQPFGDWTATDIAGANKENAFHDSRRARERGNNVVLNTNKVNRTSDLPNNSQVA